MRDVSSNGKGPKPWAVALADCGLGTHKMPVAREMRADVGQLSWRSGSWLKVSPGRWDLIGELASIFILAKPLTPPVLTRFMFRHV